MRTTRFESSRSAENLPKEKEHVHLNGNASRKFRGGRQNIQGEWTRTLNWRKRKRKKRRREGTWGEETLTEGAARTQFIGKTTPGIVNR